MLGLKRLLFKPPPCFKKKPITKSYSFYLNFKRMKSNKIKMGENKIRFKFI